MDVQFDQSLSGASIVNVRAQPHNTTQPVLIYWGLSVALGLFFLWDWLYSWHVPQTFANPGLVILLVASLLISQGMYLMVARHGGRPIRWMPTVIFAIGNGICETLAFALIYRLGATIGGGLTALLFPSIASGVALTIGLVFFSIYGGLIHALFWLRVLPPHLDDAPLARRIRKIRPIGEIALVVGWSLCLWLYQDIWTMAVFHICVDLCLMLLVRPLLFVGDQPVEQTV